jgi:hypothetical protein
MQLTALFVGVGINLIVITLVYIHLHRKIGKRQSAGHIISDVRREVDEMIVELNQTTDRNVGVIEERLQRLSRAVDEADKRIRLLQKSTDTFTMNTATYSKVRPKVRTQETVHTRGGSSDGSGELDFGPARDTQEKNRSGDPAVRQTAVGENGSGSTSAGEAGSPNAGEAGGANTNEAGKGRSPVSGEAEQTEPASDDRRKQVKELYREGMSAELIASRLDATVGEVELMITLMEEKDR